MKDKRVLLIFFISFIFIWGCTSSKFAKKGEDGAVSVIEEPQSSYQESPEQVSPEIEKEIKTLKGHFDNALRFRTADDIKSAQESFEYALTIISNNEIKSDEIYSDNDDYNEIVDLILEEYKDFINKKVYLYEKPSSEPSKAAKSEKKETYKSKYKPVSLEVNSRVNKYIKYYQGRGKKYFTLWLERMGKYKPLITKILREEGMPEEIIYLAMVESGFNPRAHSHASAVGIWQFISSTGRVYGLQINNYVDERRDPEKSTRAAIKFLKDLYSELDDWHLTMACYNVSKRKVLRAMRRHKSRDFWDLKTIPRETRNHIPKIVAAAIICKNPEKYGFRNLNYQKPLAYEEVHIDKCIDFAAAAKCAKTDYLTLKDLNPELVAWFTPPYPKGYTLKIPPKTKQVFLKNYANIPDDQKVRRVVHRVSRGETLSVIARRYHTTIYNIKSVNSLRNVHRLKIGQKLVIPVPPRAEIAFNSRYEKRTSPVARAPRNKGDLKKVTYIVKKGDTLGEIAENFKTRAGNIRSWNGLRYKRHIYPGQKLTVWVDKGRGASKRNENIAISAGKTAGSNSFKAGKVHTVRRGETLWKISKTYGIKLSSLLEFNQKNKRGIIKPGEKIIIPYFD